MFEQNLPSVTLTGVVNPQSDQARKPLRSTVKQAVSHYLAELDGEDVTELYETVLAEVEAPLLDVVMQYTRGNQTRASTLLGINRGTLRKKLKKYGMN